MLHHLLYAYIHVYTLITNITDLSILISMDKLSPDDLKRSLERSFGVGAVTDIKITHTYIVVIKKEGDTASVPVKKRAYPYE